MRRGILLAVLLAACSSSEPRSGRGGSGVVENRPADPGPPPPVVATDAGVDAAASECVAACVQRRQMVKMSIEAITVDCERDCATPPPP